MPLETRLVAAFAAAAAITWLATPLAMRAAFATGFLDRPVGYKGHRAPTPYLGGSAIMLGLVLAALAFGGATSDTAAIVAVAAGLWVLGTLDDRLNLSPFLRLALEAGAAVVLWATDNGWGVFGGGVLDLVLTTLWVIAIVNAVNLMDNMDGAAASVTVVSALAIGVLAAASSAALLAGLCFAIAGACAGFLPHNLARPARIFMGDGGSMPLGLLLACVSLSAASHAAAGANGVAIAALLVALVILDTTLVMVSRRRGGRPLMTGARDHLTHRLRARLGSSLAAIAVIAAAQLVVAVAAVSLALAGPGAGLGLGLVGAVCGAWAIRRLEDPAWFEQRAASAPGHRSSHGVIASPGGAD
ncbi:MAG TPA: MraY family glycosyltransferase [Solirubrobacteraceae bacterium]